MMKYLSIIPLLLFFTTIAQVPERLFEYEPNEQYPYGRLNPEAPPEIADFREMIGTCDCKSLTRKPDQTWADTADMTWKFKYIMNGMAVQDAVWREVGYAGSIRQYRQDSGQWVVTYFNYPGTPWQPSVWHGTRKDDKIILYNPQKSPAGMDGFYKITFYDLSESGYNWIGAWVNEDESIIYPTWKIFCRKGYQN